MVPVARTAIVGEWPTTAVSGQQREETNMLTLEDGALVTARNGYAVYVVESGVRRWVPDPSAARAGVGGSVEGGGSVSRGRR